MTDFTFNTTAQIICRPGAAADLADSISGKAGDHILFVTDKGIRNLGLEQGAIKSLENADLTVTVFDEVEADPSLETVLAATKVAQDSAATASLLLAAGRRWMWRNLWHFWRAVVKIFMKPGVSTMPKGRACRWF